jgi:type I restriction enzyme, S subunit
MELKNIDKSNWKKYKFSDLVTNINEKVIPCESGLEHYIGLKHLDAGSLKIRRFGETSSLIGNKLKIYKGDFILAKRNAYLKRVSIADFDAVASAHSFVLRTKEEYVLKEFMPFFLLSEYFWQRAIEISVGSLSPTINWKTLAKQEFLLPPKDQQAQLSKLLWVMDEVIEREKEVLKSCTRAFRGELKEEYFNTPNEFVRLRDKLDLSTGKRMKGGGLKEGDVISIGGENIDDNGNLIYTKKLFISEEFFSQMKNGKIKKNDILLMKDGAKTGKVAFVEHNIKAATNEHLFIIRSREGFFLQKYLFYFFLSDYGQQQVKNFIHGIIGGVTREDIYDMKIPETSLEIQDKVINKFDSYKSIIVETNSKIISSQSLQKSLINQIF